MATEYVVVPKHQFEKDETFSKRNQDEVHSSPEATDSVETMEKGSQTDVWRTVQEKTDGKSRVRKPTSRDKQQKEPKRIKPRKKRVITASRTFRPPGEIASPMKWIRFK